MSVAKTKARARPRRASERNPTQIVIDLDNGALRDLMIEQCRTEQGYLTVYCGSRSALLAAGVPNAAFPGDGKSEASFAFVTAHACSTGSKEQFRASMRTTAAGYEMEVGWGSVMPYTRGHRAIVELARMLLVDWHGWIWASPGLPDPMLPIDLVAEDPRAVDYKPKPGAPRPQLSPESLKALSDYMCQVYDWVHANVEIIPRPEATKQSAPPRGLSLIVDNTRQDARS